MISLTGPELRDLLAENGFHLAGSRYFNAQDPTLVPVTSSTDWDFCGQDGVETTQLLKEIGFVHLTPTSLSITIDDIVVVAPPYMDISARGVYRYNTGDEVIEVVLRSDVDRYMEMLDRVTPEFFATRLWKSGPAAPCKEDIRELINQLYNDTPKTLPTPLQWSLSSMTGF